MKKIFTVLLLVAISLSVASCDSLMDLKDRLFGGKKSKERVDKTRPTPYEVRVYSNAYDGFVNVRQAPTLKSTVLGKLKNGEEYLVQLGVQGNWVVVDWYGMTGYVNKSVVGSTPWKPVYLNVDSNWLQGWYTNGYTSYLVFSNGKYASVHQYGDLTYGVWRFEGTDIVFKAKSVTDYGRSCNNYVGQEERYGVSVSSKSFGGYKKQALRPNSYYYSSDEYYSGDMVVSKEDFQEYKKKVNKLVKLKY